MELTKNTIMGDSNMSLSTDYIQEVMRDITSTGIMITIMENLNIHSADLTIIMPDSIINFTVSMDIMVVSITN